MVVGVHGHKDLVALIALPSIARAANAGKSNRTGVLRPSRSAPLPERPRRPLADPRICILSDRPPADPLKPLAVLARDHLDSFRPGRRLDEELRDGRAMKKLRVTF